jgi:hypothetical protein
MRLPDSVPVVIPRELVGRYPSLELNSKVRNWCAEYFSGSFSVVRVRQDKRHGGFAYWVWGAALLCSEVDMVLFEMRFLPNNADGILNAIEDDRCKKANESSRHDKPPPVILY